MSPEENKDGVHLEPEDDSSEDTLSLEQINELLTKEDPRFVEGLADLKELEAPEDDSLQSLELEEPDSSTGQDTGKGFLGKFRFIKVIAGFLKSSLKAPVQFIRNVDLKTLGRAALEKIRSISFRAAIAFKELLKQIARQKAKIKKWYKSQSEVAKNSLWMMFFCFMALLGIAASFGKFDLKSLFYGVEVTTLSDYADEVFYYDPKGPVESFFSPMRRPEAYILIEPMVVHLKSTTRHGTPRLFLEYIVEASSQRTAQEIQEREKELRDDLARVTEQFTYEELMKREGKDRLREALKKRVNVQLKTGYARAFYFQEFLLR